MNKKSSTLILILVFFLGLFILLYPIVANWWNSRIQSGVISDYESVLQTMEPRDYSKYFDQADAFNEKLLNSDRPMYHLDDFPEYEDILSIPSSDVMGYISIEKLNLELPIYHGTGMSVLQVGVGHLEGTSVPVGGLGTHCALSAHRGLPSARLFSDLDDLDVGDTFTITVLDRLLTYQVDQVKIVLPKELDDLRIEPDKDYVTLITCTPYGINTHRILVRGHRVENAEVKTQITVPNEAIKIDPLIVAPIVSIPLVILVLIVVAIKYRKK